MEGSNQLGRDSGHRLTAVLVLVEALPTNLVELGALSKDVPLFDAGGNAMRSTSLASDCRQDLRWGILNGGGEDWKSCGRGVHLGGERLGGGYT